MSEKPDYLALWTHYEGRGFDDKNRMIATASLLVGFAGVLLGSAFSTLVAETARPWPAAVLGALGAVTGILSALLVRVFAIHAGRNFKAAEAILPKLDPALLGLVPKGEPESKRGYAKFGLSRFAEWISATPDGKETDSADPDGVKVGRIFSLFAFISWGVAGLSTLTVVIALALLVA